MPPAQPDSFLPYALYPFNTDTFFAIAFFDQAICALGPSMAAVEATLTEHLNTWVGEGNSLPGDLQVGIQRLSILSEDPWAAELGERLVLPQEMTLDWPYAFWEAQGGNMICYFPLNGASFGFRKSMGSGLEHLLAYYAPQLIEPWNVLPFAALPAPLVRKLRWQPGKVAKKAEIAPPPAAAPARLLYQYGTPYKGRHEGRRPALPEGELLRAHQQILSSMERLPLRQSLLVLGPKGVGKSSFIKALFQKQQAQRNGRLLWRVNPERLMNSGQYYGEWQKHAEDMAAELASTGGVLWLEDLGQVLHMGQGPDFAAYLQTLLAQRRFACYAEASPDAHAQLRERYPALMARFAQVPLPAPDEAALQDLFERLRRKLKNEQRLLITPQALASLKRLSERYQPYAQQPGRVLRWLERLLQERPERSAMQVGDAEVYRFFSKWTGLPEFFLHDAKALDTSALKHFFQSRIIGQPEALTVLENLIKVYKAGLNDAAKPIASLLFAGPTGVGKTATAKALAEYFFGHAKGKLPLLRFDMSEFQHMGHLRRLVGLGSEEGELLREVRERPFCVILLDEVEKAHPLVFDALMNVLDEGYLSDGKGQRVYFNNTIIIMTTNLGVAAGKTLQVGSLEAPRVAYEAAMRRFFRPEFYNRIDHLVLFRSLEAAHIEDIARRELHLLDERDGLRLRGLRLQFGAALLAHVAEKGFDPAYGARPLQRCIETEVLQALSRWMAVEVGLRDRVLHLDWADGALRIEPLPKAH